MAISAKRCGDGEAEVLHARVINSGPYTTARAEATKVVGVKGNF